VVGQTTLSTGGSGTRCLASTPVGYVLGTLSGEPRELIVAGEDKEQELHDKRQELREIKEEIHADETSREDKRALRERRRQLREEIRRSKDELGDTGE
jgi:hypothetical protein